MSVHEMCRGHAREVFCVAISSDGSRAFSLSEDRALRQWNVGTGEETRCVILGHGEGNDTAIYAETNQVPQATQGEGDGLPAFYCAAICPSRNVVVTGSYKGMLQVWDAQSGEEMDREIVALDGRVWCVCISRDGSRIGAGGEDATLRIWHIDTRAQVGSALRGHKRRVNCAAFSTDGRFVVSGSRDGTVRVWDVEAGTQLGTAIVAHEEVESVSFSFGGRRILSGGDDGMVRIWDVTTGAQIGRSLQAREGCPDRVSMTRDGRFVVAAVDDLRVWDMSVRTDDEDRSQDFSRTHCVTATADGRYFISGEWDGSVRVWDGRTGRQIGDTLCAHESTISCVAVSPCGRRFVSASYDELLKVWDMETHAQVGEMRGHSTWVECVSYSPDGRFVVSGSTLPNEVRLWNTATCQQIGNVIGIGEDVIVERLASLLRGVRLGAVGCFNAKAGADSLQWHKFCVCNVGVSGDGRRVACGLGDGALYVWDVRSRRLVGVRRDHKKGIVRLEMLGMNEVRSMDRNEEESRWRLDNNAGLVRLEGCEDDREVGCGREATRESGVHDVICEGFVVRLRGSDVILATLPEDVWSGRWHHCAASGVVGVVSKWERLLFLRVEL